MQPPTGTVTFLFTDIEGSTRLFQQYPDTMPRALARHDAIVRKAVERHQGYVFQVIGDGFCVAFAEADAALAAAVEAQRSLVSESWVDIAPLKVRMGLHTGTAEAHQDKYLSNLTLIRVQRIMSAGHGGQTLLSSASTALVRQHLPAEVTLRDLGPQRLRGLSQPEQVFQLVMPGLPAEFPPLRGVEARTAHQETTSLLSLLVRGRLVGRKEELAQLQSHWNLAQQARGHLVTLSGEPGVGKSRLARELMAHVQPTGASILQGGCYEYEATTPYLPFVEALRDWVHSQPAETLRRLLGSTAPELTRLAPEIESKLGGVPTNPPLPSNEERLRLMDNVARFLQALAAQGGLLFFIDDLHWADQGTLALLYYLLRHLRNDRVLFLSAYREVELNRSHPLAAALVDWNRERLVTRLALGRLSRADTGALLATLLGEKNMSADFVNSLFGETEGNPFFVEEVVKALIEQGQVYRQKDHWERREAYELAIPQSVKEAIGRRLNRLSKANIEVLHTAAALGKQFAFVELAAVSDGREDDLLDALDESIEAQLLHPISDETFAFTHDKIREVLITELNPIRRRRLHRHIGETLLELYRDQVDEHAQDLAYHFSQGGDLERTWHYSIQAAEAARRVYALDEALGFLEQAREAAQDLDKTSSMAEIAERQGEIYYRRGMLNEAVESYHQALDLTTSPSAEAVIKTKLGEAYAPVGDPRGLAVLHQALAKLDPETQSNTMAQALALVGRYHHYRTEHHQAIEYLERARQLAEPMGDPYTLSTLYSFLAGSYQHLCRFQESNHWARSSIDLGQEKNYPLATALGYEFLAENANQQGYWDKASSYADRDREIGERIGALARVAWSSFVRAWSHHEQGQLTNARQSAEEALELAERIGEARLAAWLEPQLALIAADSGNDAAARRHAERGLKRSQDLGQLVLEVYSLHAAGYRHLQLEQWDKAFAFYEQIRSLWQSTENQIVRAMTQAPAAQVFLALGRLEEASAIIQEFQILAERAQSPHHSGVGQRVEGQILVARQVWGPAQIALDSAVTVLESLNSHLELGRTLYHRAILWERLGHADRARADGERAVAIFEGSGAGPDQRRAAALLANLS